MSDGEGDAAEEPKPMIDRRREPSAHIQWYWRAQGHWKSHDCSRDDAFANGRELVASRNQSFIAWLQSLRRKIRRAVIRVEAQVHQPFAPWSDNTERCTAAPTLAAWLEEPIQKPPAN
jgi:hypothetical protein